jgi:hypothetical protein
LLLARDSVRAPVVVEAAQLVVSFDPYHQRIQDG